MDLSAWTDEDIKRLCRLREVEWDAFPAYVSQLLAPPLFIFFPWYLVLLAVLILGALWSRIRYLFVSMTMMTMANLACIVVMRGKWPVAIGSAICLFFKHQPLPAVVALVWPLLACFIGMFPAKINVHELAFAKMLADINDIFEAVESDDLQAVRTLVASKPRLARAKNRYGYTILNKAVAGGHAEIVDILVSHGAKTSVKYGGWTLLHYAAGRGVVNPEIVQKLLKWGLNPNAKSTLKETPLHYAVHSATWWRTPSKGEAAVELLLANGADPNALDSEGNTPLLLASIISTRPVVESLITYKANLNTRDESGATALHHAASRGSSEIAELLIKSGINVNVEDTSRRRPLHYAHKSGDSDMMKILIEHGATYFE